VEVVVSVSYLVLKHRALSVRLNRPLTCMPEGFDKESVPSSAGNADSPSSEVKICVESSPKTTLVDSESTATPADVDATCKMKSMKLFGMQFSASEKTARKALIGGTACLLLLNGLGLPFMLPKLRKFLGAPFVPMKRNVVEVLFDRVLPMWATGRNSSLHGLRLVDFGSGDGRLVHAAAARGMHAVGYEVNPYLVWWSRLWTRKMFLTDIARKGSADIRWANAWTADLRQVDVVTLYGRPGDGLMERAAAKCESELPAHAAVVSHFFDIPGWERFLVQDVQGLKLYDLSRRTIARS